MIYKEKELQEHIGKNSPRFKDLSNKTIGEYFIICRAPNSKGGATMFWAECSCGRIEKKCSTHIVRGKSNMCHQCSMDKLSKESFEGVGDISYAYWTNLQRHAAGVTVKRKSRRIKRFEITIEQAWELFLKQDNKCALSGVPLKFVTIGRSNRQRLKEQTASLDRIDSNGHYTIDNVQWVHKDVNRMKNVYEQEYFIDMCKNIANNN